jgi:hypothetical protein
LEDADNSLLFPACSCFAVIVGEVDGAVGDPGPSQAVMRTAATVALAMRSLR